MKFKIPLQTKHPKLNIKHSKSYKTNNFFFYILNVLKTRPVNLGTKSAKGEIEYKK